jgi:hypothetical protein
MHYEVLACRSLKPQQRYGTSLYFFILGHFRAELKPTELHARLRRSMRSIGRATTGVAVFTQECAVHKYAAVSVLRPAFDHISRDWLAAFD